MIKDYAPRFRSPVKNKMRFIVRNLWWNRDLLVVIGVVLVMIAVLNFYFGTHDVSYG